ncbi:MULTISPECIES: hypothetical protein [unclassified Nocardioides]|uniref:hypothetical protein n=1 Tax=unclassified Nocardioides TaxID=2615069 RepID=UPI0000EB62C3|nr:MULTISPECIES: hypothetical protein [unclassified Nocardioides]ABL82157.1 hypothetical protein Noca_2654 [Nocardioides sp. JS614]
MTAAGAAPGGFEPVDAFDLPDWLGVSDVTWVAEAGVRRGHAVPGHLAGSGADPIPCDLLAVDPAYPAAVAPETVRHDAHQAWRHGQVLLVGRDGRLTLTVPGTGFTADLVLEAVARLALAVGAPVERYAVLLRIGAERP